MSKTADVLQAIWTDPWFLDLSTEAKCLYLWAITTDHGNQAGLFVVSRRVMEFETGMNDERLTGALAELEGKLVYERETGTLWVVGKAKRVRAKTEQIAKSIGRAVADCPSLTIKRDFVSKYEVHAWLSEVLVNLKESTPESQNVEPHPNLTRTSGEVPGLCLGLKEEKTTSRASASDPDAIPDDFPDELRTTHARVLASLRRIAETRGAHLVTAAAVAKAITDAPLKAHVEAANDLEHWLLHGTGRNRKPKDVVGYYRNQLSQRPDLARPAAGGGPRRTDSAAILDRAYGRRGA